MRWEDEPYIRFYKRNTPEWCLLSWQARGLFGLIMRELDRAGIIEVGKLGLKAVAVAVRAPWAEIEGPLKELLEDGCIVLREDLKIVVSPNFMEAQEAASSDKARQKASRERARDLARAKSLGVEAESRTVAPSSRNHTSRDDVSRNDPPQPVSVQKSHSELPKLSSTEQPDATAVVTPLARIREALSHPAFSNIPDLDELARDRARWFATVQMSKGTKLEWFLRCIGDAAAQCVGLGLTAEAKVKKIATYTYSPRAPRVEAPLGVVSTSAPKEIDLGEDRKGVPPPPRLGAVR